MDYFLTNIKVNKVFHLENFNIPIDEKEKKHLIITGKNGSGKTVLLNAIISSYLVLKNNRYIDVNDLNKEVTLLFNDKRLCSLYLKPGIDIDFLFGFYEAERVSKMLEPTNPIKPNLNQTYDVRDKRASEFLYFLVDYKIQEALARNEHLLEDANKINQWFIEFEKLLQSIFEDNSLKLIFNYKDYSFKIQTDGKEFKFTELSAGYSAVIDIVTDLILKMQTPDTLVRAYEKQGIVLIDEIETHLHLGLQRIILPLLTHIFPNIQFIVTTHSPFILNSLPNAVAFDLERKEAISDLTDYSYEALAEGYFGVRSDSSYLQIKLDTLKDLVKKTELTTSDKIELEELICEFDQISDIVAPAIKSEYYDIKRDLFK